MEVTLNINNNDLNKILKACNFSCLEQTYEYVMFARQEVDILTSYVKQFKIGLSSKIVSEVEADIIRATEFNIYAKVVRLYSYSDMYQIMFRGDTITCYIFDLSGDIDQYMFNTEYTLKPTIEFTYENLRDLSYEEIMNKLFINSQLKD